MVSDWGRTGMVIIISVTFDNTIAQAELSCKTWLYRTL